MPAIAWLRHRLRTPVELSYAPCVQIQGLRIDPGQAGLPWRSTDVVGVEWILLASHSGSSPQPPLEPGHTGGATVLIRMAPGRGYPAHRHLGEEDVLVLAGGYRDAFGEHRAGKFLQYPSGSWHDPIALGDPDVAAGPENPACVLFACARGGIARIQAGSAANRQGN